MPTKAETLDFTNVSSNWCHMIQKGQYAPTATSYHGSHPLTNAERFCRKFGNFYTMIRSTVKSTL